jgi:hypothetical protein
VHHLVPAALVAWAIARFTPAANRKAQVPVTVMLAGLVALTLCYALYVAGIYAWLGPRAAAIYAAALPLSGLFGHYYLRVLRSFGGRLRTAGILLQRPIARKFVVALRSKLVSTIEGFRSDYAATLVPGLEEARAASSPSRTGT